MKPVNRPLLCTAALLAMALVASGCCSGKDKKKLDTARADSAHSDRDDLPHIDVDRTTMQPDGGLKTVYFDYDSAGLTTPTTMTLKQNAERILETPDVIVQIAGHCDERGTQEYNLALGERRAQSVRNHLRQLGVPGDRLVTISYGEEQPAAAGSDETAWSQNRRCEFARAVSN